MLTKQSRRIHNKELYTIYSSPNIIRMTKSRIPRWAGHVARMGRKDAHVGFWWGNLREREHLEDPSVDGRIILKQIFEK
jgi:hypothetical protein